MSHPLDACREKVKRANKHIREISDDIVVRGKVALHDNPVNAKYHAELLNLLDVTSLREEVIFSMNGTPPPLHWTFTLLAGEAIHHLRSVLDHLVYQLVIAKTKKPPTFNSAFPIVGKGGIHKGLLRAASDEYIAKTSRLKQDISITAEALIKSLQPMQRGAAFQDDPLWQLSELDNAYKHRLLLLTERGVSRYNVTVEYRSASKTETFVPTAMFEHGAELGRMDITNTGIRPGSEMKVDGALTLSVAFDEVLGRKCVPVIPLLAQLARHVSRVLDSFESEF